MNNIRSIKIEDDLPRDAHYIDISCKFIRRSEKLGGRIKIDRYEVYSGDSLIMTLFIKPLEELT